MLKSDRRIKHKEVLKAVLGVLENETEMEKIWKKYNKNKKSKEEHMRNRKNFFLEVLKLAGVTPKCYIEAVQEQTRRGVNVILARDVDEMYINNYNPEWIIGMQTLTFHLALTFLQSLLMSQNISLRMKVEHLIC